MPVRGVEGRSCLCVFLVLVFRLRDKSFPLVLEDYHE